MSNFPPFLVAEQLLTSGKIDAARAVLHKAGYTFADLVEARRSGSLGESVVAPPPPEPFRIAANEGAIYLHGHKIAIVPALLTAMAVKLIMFGGKQAAKGARRVVRGRRVTA